LYIHQHLSRRLKRIAALFLLALLVGTTGYVLLEGYSPLDAAYMTVITLTTVGFGEIRPLSIPGRVFTIAVILAGGGVAAFLFSTIAEYIIAGELAGTLRQRRMMQSLTSIRDHFIICGYGRIGQQVANGLAAQGTPLVVIDVDPEAVNDCQGSGIPVLRGDATEDDVLCHAGIERARGLVAALSSDADNVFVVLSARFLKPDLTIVARAANQAAEVKLKKAGADEVVSPYEIASQTIVNRLTKPNVTSFLELTTHRNLQLLLDEVQVSANSPVVGRTLNETDLRSETGAHIISIVRSSHRQVVDWAPDVQILADDVLIALGTAEAIQRLAQLASSDPTT
jgi:voltage-gated potassium channel